MLLFFFSLRQKRFFTAPRNERPKGASVYTQRVPRRRFYAKPLQTRPEARLRGALSCTKSRTAREKSTSYNRESMDDTVARRQTDSYDIHRPAQKSRSNFACGKTAARHPHGKAARSIGNGDGQTCQQPAPGRYNRNIARAWQKVTQGSVQRHKPRNPKLC